MNTSIYISSKLFIKQLFLNGRNISIRDQLHNYCVQQLSSVDFKHVSFTKHSTIAILSVYETNAFELIS